MKRPERRLHIPEEGWPWLGTIMSNSTGEIDHEKAEHLLTGEFYGHYAGWDFSGEVWMDLASEQWACEVWVGREPKEIILAPSLEELMTAVSEKYGWK